MNDNLIKIEQIKEALDVLKFDNQLFEVRILKGKTTISGYFTNTDTLVKAFKLVDLRNANIFYTLNVIDESCYSREQHDRFLQSKTTTSDGDITAYQWLLIDLDPVRKSGISSTKEELKAAYDRGNRIAEYLRERQWPAPVMACSGNGIHLLYSINLANNKDNVQLIERNLKALALLFNDEKVEVDTSVFNPSRISKLYGTMAQKGSSTKDRPHRMSQIISVPPVREVVVKEQLEKLAMEYPQEAQASRPTSKSSFDLEEWLDTYGIRVHAVKEWKDATRYVLEECPFDSNHKAPDATIIQMRSGAICFKCLHNSCSGRDWRELRLKYEPDAYDDKRIENDARIEAEFQQWKQYLAYNRNREDVTYQEDVIDEEHIEQAFETMDDIAHKPVKERIYIKTGVEEYDKKTGGLAKGEISLVSGLRGSAKSTLLSQWTLNAIDQDYRVVVYSGELTDSRYAAWTYQQAAGKDWVKQSTKYENVYFCVDEVKEQIRAWMRGKFYLYNNKCGNNFRLIATKLRDIIQSLSADLVIIDNMSILDLSDITEDRRADKWDQQKLFVETLKNLAEICNCHIIFVAHPSKAAGFLRLDDVGGSGSLGNLVVNAFIVHRVNRDFLRGYKRDILGIPENSKKANDEDGYEYGGDNCIEIVKERETGIQDLFIPLWYEKETRRLKNYDTELVIYKWDYDGFIGRQNIAPWEQEGADI